MATVGGEVRMSSLLLRRELIRQIRRHRGWFAGAALSDLVSGVTQGFGTALLVPTVALLLGVEGAVPGWLDSLVAWVPVGGDERLGALLTVVLVLFVFKMVATVTLAICRERLGAAVILDARSRVVHRFLHAPWADRDRLAAGELVQRITGETHRLALAVRSSVRVLVGGAVLLVFLLVMVLLSWRLTLVTALVAPLPLLAIQRLVHGARTAGRRLADESAQYSRAVLETVEGARVLEELDARSQKETDLQELAQSRESWVVRGAVLGTVSAVATEASALLLVGAVLLSLETSWSAIEPLTALTFLALLYRAAQRAMTWNQARAALAQSASSIDALAALEGSLGRSVHAGSAAFPAEVQNVSFDEVCFSYDAGKSVLDGVSLDLPGGHVTALVGRSGSGKSTLVALLSRLAAPSGGRVLVNDIDLGDIEESALRSRVAVVSSNAFLFHCSIRANIAWGLESAPTGDVERAAVAAQVTEFTDDLPRGLDTVVGDRGVLLSDGQRQRVALARALLRRPALLVLDEATAALDGPTERALWGALRADGRTILLVAHRASSLEFANRVAVLDEGRVVAVGTHAELWADSAPYRALYRDLEAEPQGDTVGNPAADAQGSVDPANRDQTSQ